VQHSKIRSRLKAQLTRFTCELPAGLSKPLRNFVGEMLFGIQASQGVKLSNIARSLQEELPLLKTEDRLSRNLQAEELETHLRQGLLRLGRRRVDTNTVLCLDLSDVRKEYARKMEFLDQVWDGSAGEVHPGYWLCSVLGAEVHGSELTPLYQQLFSVRAQDFVSENDELLSAIDQLRAQTRGRGIWAEDRGEELAEENNHFASMLAGKVKTRSLRIEGCGTLLAATLNLAATRPPAMPPLRQGRPYEHWFPSAALRTSSAPPVHKTKAETKPSEPHSQEWRGKLAATKTKAEERFLSAQADTFAGAKREEKVGLLRSE